MSVIPLRRRPDVERAIAFWRSDNPDRAQGEPSDAELIAFLVGELDAAREALEPFAAFSSRAEAFVASRVFAANDELALMPATNHFRLSHFIRARDRRDRLMRLIL